MKSKIKNNVKKLLNNFSSTMKRTYLEEILVIGDSHVAVFKDKKIDLEFDGFFFNVCEVVGATVSGLENPNSKTQALPIFERAIQTSKAKKIIVSLGEVDTGFVIWFRAEKKGCSVEKMLDVAVLNYINLINKIALKAQVICISAPLPTIRDNQCEGGVANLRQDVKATQRQRTDLTIAFNKRVEQYFNQKSYAFINLDSTAIGKDGVVSNNLMNSDPNDHHYCSTNYINMLLPRLKLVL